MVGVAVVLGLAAITATVVATSGVNKTRLRGTPVVWTGDIAYCRHSHLVRVNPNTLSRLPGPRLRLPDASGALTFSPDGKLAAVDGSDHGRIVFVDPNRMRRLGALELGGWADTAETIAWPRPRTLVALDVDRDAHDVGLTKVVIVDPLGPRVERQLRFSWWAELAHGTTRNGRTAILLVSWRHLTTPRLVIVDADGSIRQLRIQGFSAGVGFDRIGETRRFPAMAVDPRSERAYVLLEHEPVAVIDLRTVRIRYRYLRLPAPQRRDAGPLHATGTDNPTHGPQREAAWVGKGRIALAGFDSWTGDGGAASRGGERDAGAGLSIIDTRSWSVQTLRRGTFSFQPGTARVVAFGYSNDPRVRLRQSLFVFGPHGRLAYTVPVSQSWTSAAGRLLVGRRQGRSYRVLDAVTGRQVGVAPQRRVLATGFGYCA